MAKTIAITGAGDGLGRALARRFAKDGDTVILLGRTLAKVQAVADELGAPHFAVHCDVGRADSVRTAFAAIAEKCPKIDVLINNAAIFYPMKLESAEDARIEEQLDTNLKGPILVAREALPLLKGGGHIINVTSESSHLKMPMLWLYAGTKQALELMSDMWGRELEEDGVRVTVVQCGQMMDETKTGSTWPQELSMQFGMANAKAGINLRERGISHYNHVTDAFRAVLDTTPDVHLRTVEISARPVAR